MADQNQAGCARDRKPGGIKAGIAALASYIPPLRVTNDMLAEFLDTSDEWISTRTGIKARHISEGENTSEMCVKGAKKLISQTGLDPNSIGLIIVTTSSPDYLFPNCACAVQAAIGAENAMAFDLHAGCTGFVYSMSVADKYIRAGAFENVLVIAAEALSKIMDWNDRSTCVLFGDGCAAALVTARETGVLCEIMGSDGNAGKALTGGYIPVINPFVKDPPPPTGFDYTKMDGRVVMDFALNTVKKNIDDLIRKSGINMEDVKWWLIHQANKRIVDALAKKLELPLERFCTNIHEYGNVSSVCIPLMLEEMIEKGIISLGSGEKVVLCGFGGGLTYGSILMEL